jgi:hypothetical protein
MTRIVDRVAGDGVELNDRDTCELVSRELRVQ